MKLKISKISSPNNVDFAKSQIVEYFGLNLVIPEDVYDPMEDTDLSIHFLRKWLDIVYTIQKNNHCYSSEEPLRVLEMGCGSGALSFYVVSRLLKNSIPFYHNGIDINPIAIEACKYSAELNHLSECMNFLHGSHFSPLSTDIEKNAYDIVIYNPPYLPSEEETINDSNRQLIDLAWDGGPEGNEVTLDFLNQLSPYIKSGGHLMIISSSHVDQKPIFDALNKTKIKIIETLEKKIFFETIFLYHGLKS